jgi:uncharacterized protein (DUF58 family)
MTTNRNPASGQPRDRASFPLRANRHTVGLAAVLLAMFYAGWSQNNAAAYLLAFLVGSVAAASSLHAWANLRGLELTAEPFPAVFEGEPLVVPILLRSSVGRRHFGVCLSADGAPESFLVDEVPAGEGARGELLLPTPRRGRFEGLEIEISSSFPLGFFTAQHRVTLTQVHYVYPRPEGDVPLPAHPTSPVEAPTPPRAEGDDFAGVRMWQMGESMRHVDWKAVARGQRLMVKQWAGGASPHFVFDYATLSGMPDEARLRQLARWVVVAERLGASYEMLLPGANLPLGNGERHFHAALRLLAEAPVESANVSPPRSV